MNAQTLNVVSPLATLGRSYAIVRMTRIASYGVPTVSRQAISARFGQGNVPEVTKVNSVTE